MKEDQDVAIFWDLENIQATRFLLSDLIEEAESFGRVVIRRAFADWRKRSEQTAKDLLKNQFELHHFPHKRHQKNSVDISMAVNIMETIISHPNISSFLILSDDKDFRPIVQAIRRRGKEVCLICDEDKADTELLGMVDRSIHIDDLGYTEPEEEVKEEETQSDLSTTESKSETGEELLPVLFHNLTESIRHVSIEQENASVDHNTVLTRLKIIDPKIDSKIKTILKWLKKDNPKWYLTFLNLAAEEGYITIDLEDTIYKISVVESTKLSELGLTNEQRVTEYFAHISKILKNLDNPEFPISTLAQLANKADYTYKGLFSSFLKALEEMKSRKLIKLYKKKNTMGWWISEV
ncbi:MAG: NYN domain-containing protein [Candidatus Kariarchaeaceae archaeon]